MRDVLVAAVVLICPLMMLWMMRGHGHGMSDHEHAHQNDYRAESIENLRRQRDKLDRTIAEREQFESDDFGGQYEHDSTATRSG